MRHRGRRRLSREAWLLLYSVSVAVLAYLLTILFLAKLIATVVAFMVPDT